MTSITLCEVIVEDFCFLKAMDKLKRQLAEAEAALESRKKPPEETGPRVAGEGLVIDEWVRHLFLTFSFSPHLVVYWLTSFHFLTLCSLVPYVERKKRKIPRPAAGRRC